MVVSCSFSATANDKTSANFRISKENPSDLEKKHGNTMVLPMEPAIFDDYIKNIYIKLLYFV